MNNKKVAVVIIVVGALVVIFSYYVFLNQSIKETALNKETTTLSDFQVTACNAADRSDTCRTKLPKLNLITPEECCKYLGKCC